MKIGAENRKQLIIMVALLAVAAGVLIYDFAGSSNTSSAAPPASSAAARPGARGKTGGAPAVQNDLDPTLHLGVLEASRRVKYEAGGRNIFRMEEPKIEQPKFNVRTEPTPAPTPPPPPPPPPIPLKFYGFASKPSEPKRVFLAEGDEVFIARQGEIVDRRYRVAQIMNTSVVIEDMLTNNKQTIPLTAR